MEKGITPIIGVIVLLLITVGLVGSAYTFLFGISKSSTAKTIKISPGSQNDNTVVVQNLGKETIQPGELSILVNGEPATIINPQPIPSGKSGLVEFDSPLQGKDLNIRISSPTNVLTYLVDIGPAFLVLNSPLNGSTTINSYALLNWTLSQSNNNPMEVWVYGANSTANLNQAMLYHNTGLSTGTYTYNFTSPVTQPDSGTVLLLHLDNRSEFGENNTHVFDFSGNGNNGTVIDALPNTSGGYLGGAFGFDGSGDSIRIPDSSSLNSPNVSQNITIAAWVNLGSVNTWAMIAIKGNGQSNPREYSFGANLNGYMHFAFFSSGWRPYTDTQISIENDNKWHHVAVTYNQSAVQFYVDGLPKDSFTENSSMISNAYELAIASTRVGTWFWNGAIDELTLWNRSLSASEILGLYQLGANKYFWNVTVSDGINMASEIFEFNAT